jgi:hypothetical protein
MGTLHQKIAKKFVSLLADGKEVDPEKIEQIRKLLTNGKKPKADDFVKIFSAPVAVT